jgi:hypothetical protein
MLCMTEYGLAPRSWPTSNMEGSVDSRIANVFRRAEHALQSVGGQSIDQHDHASGQRLSA